MREQTEFTDDTVIVTGSTPNIGHGVAEEFTDGSATVVIADIDENRGSSVAKDHPIGRSGCPESHTNPTVFLANDVTNRVMRRPTASTAGSPV